MAWDFKMEIGVFFEVPELVAFAEVGALKGWIEGGRAVAVWVIIVGCEGMGFEFRVLIVPEMRGLVAEVIRAGEFLFIGTGKGDEKGVEGDEFHSRRFW